MSQDYALYQGERLIGVLPGIRYNKECVDQVVGDLTKAGVKVICQPVTLFVFARLEAKHKKSLDELKLSPQVEAMFAQHSARQA
jgi:hypothetical protein